MMDWALLNVDLKIMTTNLSPKTSCNINSLRKQVEKKIVNLQKLCTGKNQKDLKLKSQHFSLIKKKLR